MAVSNAQELADAAGAFAKVTTDGGAALLSKPSERAPEAFEKSCGSGKSRSAAKKRAQFYRWALVVGVTSLSCSLFVADFFTFDFRIGSSWVADLFKFGSWGSYAAEITLVVSVAVLLMMRSVAPAPGRETRTRKMIAKHCDDASGCTRHAGPAVFIKPAIICTRAIETAVREGDWEKGEQLLLEFERSGGTPEAMSYNWVIRACAKRGEVIAAERWLKRMEDRGVQATVLSYNTLFDAFAQVGKPEACEQLLSRMIGKGIEPNVISYATCINACAKHGDVAAAEGWLERMLAAGVEPDAVTYSSLIHACGVKRGAAKDAERWLQAMVSRGLEVNVTTYTAVIDACAKSGDVERAEFWFIRMTENGVQPNAVTFSAMIDSCAKAGKLARAEHWYEKMLERGVPPNAHSLSAVINACAKQSGPGQAEAAERWLDRGEQAGVQSDVVLYTTVIDACGKAGDVERALRVFRRMQAQGLKPQIYTYSALAGAFAHKGDWVQVETFAEEMVADGIAANEFFLYAQLLSYSVARQGHRAETCFRGSIHAGIKANDHVVGVLARAVGRARCTELMGELCGGRDVPLPRQRRHEGGRSGCAWSSTEGGVGASGSSARLRRP